MITSIRLKRSTKALLDEIGNKGQTYDQVVLMLVNDFVEARKWIGIWIKYKERLLLMLSYIMLVGWRECKSKQRWNKVEHLSCGGQVLFNKDECVWFCGRCSKVFISIEDLATDNMISEKSEEDWLKMDLVKKIKIYYYVIRLIFEYPYSIGFNERGYYIGEPNWTKRFKKKECEKEWVFLLGLLQED